MRNQEASILFLVGFLFCRAVPVVLCANDTSSSFLRGHPIQAQAERRTQDCPSTDTDNVAFSFTMEQIHVFWDCTKLMLLDTTQTIEALKEEQKDNYETFEAWKDCVDVHIVAKSLQGQCLVFFQEGSDIVTENVRNLDPFRKRVEGSDCAVRAGYYRKYDGKPWTKDFRNAIDTCVDSCTGGCDLYMTGYSQFGAHALAAAIDFRRYDPYTVTFGATRVILCPFTLWGGARYCNDYNGTRHFRFVKTDETGYDFVPNTPSPYSAIHKGHELLLDDLTTYTIGYPGLNNDRNRFPVSLALHDEVLYQNRIKQLLDSGCDAIPVAKWEDGHRCRYNDECNGGKCKNKLCTTPS